jgi:diguanylate cyclase (GGDEF)-like protein
MSYYIVALTIIAVLSVASHLILEHVLRANQGSAAIINISGRQRMLSQRIASLAAQYRLGDASARGDLVGAIDAFEAAHQRLIGSVLPQGQAGQAEADLRALYFAGAQPLDEAVRGFVADARAVAARPADDPASARPLAELLAEARAPLLTALNEVVTIHQRESERKLAELERVQWGILAVVLATLVMEAVGIFRPLVNRIVAFTQEVLRLASTDPLTGVANRRSFLERAAIEIARARADLRPLSLLMVDADHFKKINDAHGHAAGDEVLRALASALTATVRPADMVARIGGEEFAILLPRTKLAEAAGLAERLRQTVARLVVPQGEQGIRFTVSIGAAPLLAEARDINDVLSAADAALYRAKKEGRDRVVAGV